MNNPRSTHFGFSTVAWEDKQKKVSSIFSSVAHKYDLMNNIMSLGIHHLWKRWTVELSRIHAGDRVLDLAGGTGDLTALLSKKVGLKGQVVLADINAEMLAIGRDRLLDQGMFKNIRYIQANAEELPFANNYFNCVLIGFGLRNITDQSKALKAMFRVCKPGGKLVILEFSRPIYPGLNQLYDWYSFSILPKLGEIVAQDSASYRYLAESIRMHPAQDELKKLIESTGFEDCQYYNLTGGITAIHIAYKY